MAGFFTPGVRPAPPQTHHADGREGGLTEHNPLLIAAFDLMWRYYPEPVMLIHRSRLIVRLNEAGRGRGRAEGGLCSAYGAPESHRDCLAEQLLATQSPP